MDLCVLEEGLSLSCRGVEFVLQMGRVCLAEGSSLSCRGAEFDLQRG